MKQPANPRFLLRFDDVCPTMKWSVWNDVENILIETGVKPILAVVPDNRDEELILDPPDANFWTRVRAWQERGWTIGLHGYQHRYVTKEAGLFGRTARSEFAGLPLDVQEAKLRNALRIFHHENVFPELWVAPAHSFDANTVAALSNVGMRTISDGYTLYPFEDLDGITWIPQQVGRFRKMPFGVWTICHHINDWTLRDVAQFGQELSRFSSQFASIPQVLECYKQRRRNWLDVGIGGFLRLGRRTGRIFRENLGNEAASSSAEKVCESFGVARKS